METKNWVMGLLAIFTTATSIFIVMNGPNGAGMLAMNITEFESQFYVNSSGEWVLAGVESSQLMILNESGEFIKGSINNVSYDVNGELFTAYRHAFYSNAIVKETYVYNSSNDQIELFPVIHKIEIINGTGMNYRYAASNLAYSGPELNNLPGLVQVGYNMSVEWFHQPDNSTLYSNGTLVLDQMIKSNYEVFEIRLFDPITVVNITQPLSNNSYLGNRNPIIVTFVNTSNIDKCWYSVNGGVNNTLQSWECGNIINFSRIWEEGSKFNITIYVNQSDGAVNSTTRLIQIKTAYRLNTQFMSSSYVVGDILYAGNVTNLLLINTTDGTVTSKYAPVSFYYMDYKSSTNELVLTGTSDSFFMYNISSGVIVNKTNNTKTVLSLGQVIGSTYDNSSNLVWMQYRGVNNQWKLFAYNLSNDAMLNYSASLPTPLSNYKIYHIKYDYERDVVWLSLIDNLTKNNYNFGYLNKTTGTFVNISYLPGSSYVIISNFDIDYSRDLIYFTLDAGTNSADGIYYYNITSNSFTNITAYCDISTSNLGNYGDRFLKNRDVMSFQVTSGGFVVYNLTDNSCYNYQTNLAGSTLSLPIQIRYMVDDAKRVYFGVQSSGGIYSEPSLNSNQNQLLTTIVHNNSYSNSINPIGFTVNDTSPISDCWYNINDGANVSIKLYGCNLTTAINNFAYKFALEIGTTHNFSLFTNNSVNNLSSLYFENITIRNMYDLVYTIPFRFITSTPNEMIVLPDGTILFSGNSGVLAKYNPDENIIQSISQNDINNSFIASNVNGLKYDSFRNVVWIGLTSNSTNLSLYYLNLTDDIIYRGDSYNPFVAKLPYSAEIDYNSPEMLYFGSGAGNLTKYNITSGVFTDLSTVDSGGSANWFGTSAITSLKWFNYSGTSLILIGVVGSNEFGYYNVSSNVATLKDLGGTQTRTIDSYNDSAVTVGTSTNFGIYNVYTGTFQDLTNTATGTIGGQAQHCVKRIGDILYLNGRSSDSDKLYGAYDINSNKTYASRFNSLISGRYPTRCAYDSVRDRLYFTDGSAFGLFYLDSINASGVPSISVPQLNRSYYSLYAPILVQIFGKRVDSCKYSINGAANVSFNCNNNLPINITPTRIVGLNNLTITINDSSNNEFSYSKSFKTFNFSVTGSSASANILYTTTYDSSVNGLYLFGGSGQYGRTNLTSNSYTDLSSTDTGNWVGTSIMYSSCKGYDDMIYFSGSSGKFGYYNKTSNVATNLSSYVNSYTGGTTPAIYSIDCHTDGSIFLAGTTGQLIRYYPSNNTVDNLTNISVSSSQNIKLKLINPLSLVAFSASTLNGIEQFGYYNITSNQWTWLSFPFTITKGAASSQFTNIETNDIDTIFYGGYSEILRYNVTSEDYELLINNDTQGALSTLRYVQTGDAMFYDNSTDRLFFISSFGVQSYINLTSKKQYNFYLPFFPNQSDTTTNSLIINKVGDNLFYQGYVNPNRDLFVVNSSQLIDEYPAGAAPTDSCTYTSGNHVYQCSDGCNLAGAISYGGNNITFNGTGQINITGNLSNYNKAIAQLGCQVFVKSGGRLI